MTSALTYFPTYPVDGPPPLRPPFGLLQAAESPAAGVRIVVDTTVGPVPENTIAPTDAGLEEGLYRRPDGAIMQRTADGGESEVYVPDQAGLERWEACAGSGAGEKSFGDTIPPPEFNGLTISEPITCTAQQVPDEAAFRARAVAVLTATEGFAVARELMAGGINGSSPHLADTHATMPNGSAATKPNHGLQVLEEAIGLTGRLGVIHCSPMLATALMGAGFALSDKTGVIRTINGNVVIPDGGYIGVSKPDSGATPGPGEEWAYATGPVDIRRSAVFTSPDTLAQALDRGLGATNDRINTITYRAERYYIADWDTALQAAVLIDRCGTDCAIGS